MIRRKEGNHGIVTRMIPRARVLKIHTGEIINLMSLCPYSHESDFILDKKWELRTTNYVTNQ